MIAATRRRFFSFVGASPLAARAAAEKGMAEVIGINANGLGNPNSGGAPLGGGDDSYRDQIIASGRFVETFGIPEVIESVIREQSRWVASLDPDIANKRSWSMAVKVMTQRQRNYDREINRIKRRSSHFGGLATLRKIIGFEWPW